MDNFFVLSDKPSWNEENKQTKISRHIKLPEDHSLSTTRSPQMSSPTTPDTPMTEGEITTPTEETAPTKETTPIKETTPTKETTLIKEHLKNLKVVKMERSKDTNVEAAFVQ